MSVVAQIKQVTALAIKELFKEELTEQDIQVNATKPEFEGDYTVVLFAFIKRFKKSPEALGNELGTYLVQQHGNLFSSYNVIKGFLNLVVDDAYWSGFLQDNYNNAAFGKQKANNQKVMVEYSSPNTNKPLHLGHLRNNFLGWSTAAILQANGFDITKTCIVNDRGIHICKSMIAWQLFANGATPESTGTKGDHFVGDYYVKFNDELKKQAKPFLEMIYDKKELSVFNEEERKNLDNHLSKINELAAVLKKAADVIDVKAIAKLGDAAQAFYQNAMKGEIKWKAVSKCFDEDEYKDLDPKEKEEKQKLLGKNIKPVTTRKRR